MNKRDICIGITSACVGVFVGLVIATKQYKERLEAEIKLTEQLISEINRTEKKVDKTPSIHEISIMPEEQQKTTIDKLLDHCNYRQNDNLNMIPVEGEHTYKDRVDPDEIDIIPDGYDYRKDPYVISFEEFCDGVTGFGEETITYYAGDDTLADFNENIIANRSDVIGDEALTNFGMGEDSDVVYVRNEALSCDYGIVRHPGKYQKIVCGFVEGDEKEGGDDEEEGFR